MSCQVRFASKNEQMVLYPVREVIETMRAKVDEYKKMLLDWQADPEANPLPKNRKGKPGKPADLLLPIANLSLHSTL